MPEPDLQEMASDKEVSVHLRVLQHDLCLPESEVAADDGGVSGSRGRRGCTAVGASFDFAQDEEDRGCPDTVDGIHMVLSS